MSGAVTWSLGGDAVVLTVQGDVLSLRSSRAFPPGAPAAGTLAGEVPHSQMRKDRVACRGMEDGQVRADHAWARRLRRAIADEPLLGSLIAACASLASVGIDIDLLEEIFRRQERDWRRQRKLEGLGLPDSFMNFALAIYVYTLEDPAIYTVVNRAMYNPARRSVQGVLPGPDLSPELQACLPYIRFLDTALERLPEAFIFRGRVHRGVRSPPRRARARAPRPIASHPADD